LHVDAFAPGAQTHVLLAAQSESAGQVDPPLQGVVKFAVPQAAGTHHQA
jgi:hypothetical protein